MEETCKAETVSEGAELEEETSETIEHLVGEAEEDMVLSESVCEALA